MTWSEYMEKYGAEEYHAWDAAVRPLTERIAELEAEVAELRRDRARLDWLQSLGYWWSLERNSSLGVPRWQLHCACAESGPSRNSGVRDAIDAAMARGGSRSA